MLKRILAATLLVALPVSAQAADLKKGEKVFKKCGACHAVGEGAKNKVGPQLNGIIGRKAGSLEGFKFSKAMAESGITWDEKELDEFLTKPRKKIKGTKMIYAGLKKEKQRVNLIAYLASFKADGTKAETAAAE